MRKLLHWITIIVGILSGVYAFLVIEQFNSWLDEINKEE